MNVFIDGADYDAHFLLRGDAVKLPTAKAQVDQKQNAGENPSAWTDKQSILFPMRAGAAYLRAAFQEISLAKPGQVLTRENSPYQEVHRAKLFEIHAHKRTIPDHERFGETLPFLESRDGGGALVLPPCLQMPAAKEPSLPKGRVSEKDILIERIAGGELLKEERESLLQAKTAKPAGEAGDSCGIHIQIGRADMRGEFPAVKAKDIRCVIVTLRDLVAHSRIRKSISYESIIVDILRLLRGYSPKPRYSKLFYRIVGMHADAPKQLYIMIRINHAAVMVYRWQPPPSAEQSNSQNPGDLPQTKTEESESQIDEPPAPDSAYLFFHHRHPAPMDDTTLGKVDGFSGFLAVHLAEQARRFYENSDTETETGNRLPKWIEEGLSLGILWQVAENQRGVLKLFFEDTSQDPRSGLPATTSRTVENPPSAPGPPVEAGTEGPTGQLLLPRSKAFWKPILDAQWENRRRHYFAELKRYLQNEEKWDDNRPAEGFKRVQVIKLRVANAVSHRMQWFLAGDHLIREDQVQPTSKEFEKRFTEIAKIWLTEPENNPKSDPKNTLPLVTIGILPLMDRREVEDYLALRDAIRNYEKGGAAKPLNIAVFGSPGAGKSFGVTQVVTHAAKTEGSRLNAETLSFNVSQFTSLHDLVTALHLVRNECLKNKIPVVFFDEFDSSFEERPFGWLKYFLAPMQDGEFTDGGRIYRLGACVIVFAGGVNRSFEELNGRLRNPGFVEAKGPDFVSRLRAHMNIRGINKPEDDVDQSRYILRRAIMLHGMLTRRLNLETGAARGQGLLEPSVASAFCGVASFKHGARSMEAILDMCDLRRGRRLGPSDLPAKAQLEMHVDAAEFIDLVFEFSEDTSPEEDDPDAGDPSSPP